MLQFTDVTFGYSPDKVLYRNVDLGADLDSRVAVVSLSSNMCLALGLGILTSVPTWAVHVAVASEGWGVGEGGG